MTLERQNNDSNTIRLCVSCITVVADENNLAPRQVVEWCSNNETLSTIQRDMYCYDN